MGTPLLRRFVLLRKSGRTSRASYACLVSLCRFSQAKKTAVRGFLSILFFVCLCFGVGKFLPKQYGNLSLQMQASERRLRGRLAKHTHFSASDDGLILAYSFLGVTARKLPNNQLNIV